MNKQIELIEPLYKTEEDANKDALLSIISDKHCRAIIGATIDKPKSAIELTVETKIPISTVYRRLQTLHDRKLLHTSGMISDDGKKLFLYKNKIKGFHSTFDNGQINVKLIFNQ